MCTTLRVYLIFFHTTFHLSPFLALIPYERYLGAETIGALVHTRTRPIHTPHSVGTLYKIRVPARETGQKNASKEMQLTTMRSIGLTRWEILLINPKGVWYFFLFFFNFY